MTNTRSMQLLMQDVRFGLRMLVKNPAFAAVAVLTLALSIGANAAIFSVVSAVLFQPLPFRDSDRIVVIWEENQSRGWTNNPVSPADFLEWRKQSNTFAEFAAFRQYAFAVTKSGIPEEVIGEKVTSSFFTLLGTPALVGRTFLSSEDDPGAPQGVVLSHSLWQRLFGGNRQAIGEQISLNKQLYTVIGVMPPTFSHLYTSPFIPPAQLWTNGASLSSAAHGRSHLAIGRLKSGVTLKEAQAEMATIARRTEGQDPNNQGWSVSLVQLRDEVVGSSRLALMVLWGAVAFILLIACANLANLLLARGASREKEIAIRKALGANKVRLVRQILTESLMLAAAGGVLGIAIAVPATKTLIALAPPILFQTVPGLKEAGVDGRVILFTLAVAVMTAILFGLGPALGMTKPAVNEALKDNIKGSSESGRGNRIRSFLVVAEFALALMLLTEAGLMLKTLQMLDHVNFGFNAKDVLTMRVPLFGPQYRQPEKRVEFYRELLSRLKVLPGVKSVAVTRGLPIEGWDGENFMTENTPGNQLPAGNYVVVSPDYFATLQIPLRKGRFFTDSDSETSEKVAVVNEKLAQQYWPGQDPIGRHIRMGAGDSDQKWLSVVGVAGNLLSQGPDGGFNPEIYVPYQQYPWMKPPQHLVARISSDPNTVASEITRAAAQLDKDQPVSDVRMLDQIAGEPAAQQRLVVALLGVFAVLALVLAAMGIYSVMSYSVAQRTREIGIRLALGSTPGRIIGLVVKKGLILALMGVALGLLGALVVTNVLSSMLYGIKPTDSITFAEVSLLLLGVVLLACYIPARKVAKVDPLAALR